MTVRDIVMAAAGAEGVPPSPSDPQFNYVTMLLHGDGTNGAQNNTFLDSSSNNFTITRTGTPTQGSFSPYGDLWSNYFNGTSGLIATGQQSNSVFSLPGDFTIEGWVYLQTTSPATFFYAGNDTMTTGGYGFVYSSGNIGFAWKGYNNSTATTPLPQNTWTHLAAVRSGSTITLYKDGVAVATSTTSDTLTPNADPALGQNNRASAQYYWVGHISNFRLVKGTALYTSSFTPSTTPLTAVSGTSLLTCQSSRFKDNSSNNFAITVVGGSSIQVFSPFAPATEYSPSLNGGSVFFPGGATNYVSIPSSTSLLMTGDFTLECWVMVPSTATQTTYANIYNGPSSPNISLYSNFAGNNNFGVLGASPSFNIQSGIGAKDGAWHHLAFVRNGTAMNLYVDGIVRGSTITSSATIDLGSATAARLGAGSNGASDNPFIGYVSNLRIIKGTAVYTTNFTPPTAPLTAITNTSLLLNFTNAGIYNDAKMSNLTTVGNAQVSTSVKKYGTGSLAFDGTGDWLTLIDTPNVQLGAGNFTIEGWVYLSTTGTTKYIAAKGTSTTGWAIGVNSSNQLVFNYTASTLTGSTSLSSGQWYHVAVVRSGTATGNVKIYLDGTATATSGGAINDNFNQTNIGYVGADRTGANAMNGYIDDLRITKGVARYTANFTPPTAAFPNK